MAQAAAVELASFRHLLLHLDVELAGIEEVISGMSRRVLLAQPWSPSLRAGSS